MKLRLPALVLALAAATTARAGVSTKGLYHNNAGQNPEFETVPGLGLPFRDVNSSTSRVTIRFLTDTPGGGTNDAVSARVRLYSNREYLEPASLVSNVVLAPGNTFHFTPAAGSLTVSVWQVTWHPTFAYTGYVFYAPQVLAVASNSLTTNTLYMIRDIGTNTGPSWGTNSSFWLSQPQAYGADYNGLDFAIVLTNFLPNPYEGFFFNATNFTQASAEIVPGLGVPFLDYRYGSNQASFLNILAPLSGVLSATARLFYLNGAGEYYAPMSNWTTTVISSGAPFHGVPTAGSITLAVWQAAFFPPSGWTPTNVYFSPRVQVLGQTESVWLTSNTVGISDGVVATNGFNPAQYFASQNSGYFGRDWTFVPTGTITRPGITFDWAYCNNTALNPQTESVPSYDGSTFLEVDYSRTTTTFFVLTEKPFTLVPGEDMSLRMHIGWFNPQTPATNFVEEYPAMSVVTDLVISSASPFHGLPAAGTHTVLLWRLDWQQPVTNGLAMTNEIAIYYSPLMKSQAGSLQELTDERYLVRGIEGATNGWGSNNYTTAPQFFGRNSSFHDFSYVNKPVSLDHSYFNNTNGAPPETETVPGLGVPFFVYNYATNQPGYFHILTPLQGVASVTVRCYFVNSADETFFTAAPYTTTVLSATNSFHGEPAAADITVAVWRAAFLPPPNWSNNTMYFAPRITLSNGPSFWCVKNIDGAGGAQTLVGHWPTNGQFLYADPNGYVTRDWSYTPTAAVVRSGLDLNWAYHNNTNRNAETENVPGYAAVFRDANFAASNTTFYLLTADPLALAANESLQVELRTSWTTNFVQFSNTNTAMSRVTNLVIDSGSPFHGLPAAGAQTVELWRASWPHPWTNGVPVTNIYIYYSFFLRTTMGSANYETDSRFLLMTVNGATNGWGSNNYPSDPQLFGRDFFGHDYPYTNRYPIVDTDGDGIPDIYENNSGTFADTDHTGTDPAQADTDHDGQSDGDEVVAGTDPTSAGSTFLVRSFRNSTNGLTIQWSARTNRLYRVESLDTWPTGTSYTILHTDLSVAADGTLATNIPPNAAGTLRLRVRRP